MWMLLLACQPELASPSTVATPGTDGPLEVTEPLTVAGGTAAGAVRVRVTTDRPTRLEVVWDDEQRAWPNAETHDVPVVGLGID
ncbi:MAG: hypothetical protein AAF211_22745, partial [Myxococcota bacterium]